MSNIYFNFIFYLKILEYKLCCYYLSFRKSSRSHVLTVFESTTTSRRMTLMSSMMELLLKILLLCLTVVIKVVFTGVASFAMHGSCSHRNAREHGSSFPLLDFVFYWFVRTAQGVYVLTLVALTKIATCNSILSWHWQSSRTCDSTHQFSI